MFNKIIRNRNTEEIILIALPWQPWFRVLLSILACSTRFQSSLSLFRSPTARSASRCASAVYCLISWFTSDISSMFGPAEAVEWFTSDGFPAAGMFSLPSAVFVRGFVPVGLFKSFWAAALPRVVPAPWRTE